MRTHSLHLLFLIPLLFGSIEKSFSQVGGDIQVINLEFESSRELVYIQGALTEVHLCQLKPGETYYIQAVVMDGCQPLLELAGYSLPPQSIFNFVAGSECQTIYVHAEEGNPGCQGVMYLSVMCSTCTVKPAKDEGLTRAPISVIPGLPAQTLVDDVFVGGGCFDVAGVSHLGAAMGRGSFSNGMTSIGLSNGVILSSGNVSLATGPNNMGNAGATSGGGTDPDLAQAAGTAVFDASVLTFQFTPTQSQITFKYVFASEEYCEYVNSGFNDVFGFFLSGPGISGPYSNNAANIAVLPGGLNVPVTINNVNHITNSGYYVPNIPNPPTTGSCAGHPNAGPPGTLECQYDGFTTVLTAVANVIPCETYTIKLGVADAGDSVFDSAVFLEANSFDAGGDAAVVAVVPFTQSTLAYEGCTPAHFLFTRSGGPSNIPLVINFSISGTATPGVDYGALPTSITIPPNQNQFILPVNIFSDLLAEGIETIIIDLFNPCSCTTSSATLQISDLPPISLSLPDQTVCSGQPVFITPSISGGVPPFTYSWSPQSSPPNSPVYVGTPTQTGPITLTVTDHCGTTATATSNVTVYTLTATLSGSGNVCTGGPPAFLTVNFTGPGPWNLTYLINGGNPTTINGITQNPYQIQATQAGVYSLIAVTNGACLGTVSGQAVINLMQVNLSQQTTNISCNGLGNGAIDLGVGGGTAPYTYAWSNSANTQDIQNLGPGSYTVTVTDAMGCYSNLTVPITQPPALNASINVLSGVDCQNPTGGALDLSVSGGVQAYSYLWNTGDSIQDLSGLTAGIYSVIVTDANGCEQTATAEIEGDTNIPTATVDVLGAINCLNEDITLDASSSSSGPAFVYQWVASGGGLLTGPTDELVTTATGPGVYELTVNDTINNCFTITSVLIQGDYDTPEAIPGPDQIINCYASEVVLDGAASTSGPNIVYAWSTQTGNFTSATDIPSPTADADGLYTLIVTNAVNGCADTATVNVTTDLADPVADVGPGGVLDCSAPVFELGGNGTSAGPEFTYAWTTGDGNITGDPASANPTVDQEGTYTLLVTNTVNGCTSTDQVFIEDLIVLPEIQIEAPALLTCAVTEINLDASNSDSGPEYAYSWTGGGVISGGNTPTPLIGATGTYYLLLTNTQTGCEAQDSIVVNDDVIDPLAEAGVPLTITCDLPDIPLDGSGSSLGPPFSYSWTTGDGNIVSGATTLSPQVNSPGIYLLTVLDNNNGCTAQDSVLVQLDNNTPNAVATAPQILDCAHPDVLINGIGSSLGPNFVYNWATNDGNIISGNGTLFLTVGAAGTYTLTVTNLSNSCWSETDVTVGIDTLAPIAQIATPELLTCATTEIGLSGAGSSAGPEFTYVWSTSNGNLTGDPAALDTEADQPGAYTLTVSNSANGCSQSTTIQVLQDVAPPDASASAPGPLTCGITQVSLSGSGSSAGPDFSYSWTTADGNILSGNNTLTPLVDAPGVYEIEVLNAANGCSNTALVTLGQDITPPQALILPPATLTCAQTSVTLNGASSSGTSPLLYAWTTTNGNIIGSTSVSNPQADQPGTYTLVVTNSGNECTATASVTVAQDIAPPVASAGPTFELDCGVTSIALDGSGSSTGANFSYAWSTGNGIILGGGTSLSPMVGSAGTYELTVTNQTNGCTSTDQVVVTLDDDAPTALAGAPQTLTCAVTQVSLNGAGSSQGSEFTYLWTTTNGNIVSGNTGLTPTVNMPGAYVLSVTNLLNNCVSSASVMVAQDIAPPIAAAGAPATITCSNTTVSLNGGGSSQGPNFTYAWSTTNGNIVSGPNTLTPQADQPGAYTLLVTNTANGCTATSAVNVNVDQTPPMVAIQTPGLLTCAVTQLTLGATGTSTGANFSYQWTTTDGNITGGSTSLAPTINAPGTYLLTVTNSQNGCVASESAVVAQNIVNPTAEAGATAQLTCAVTQLQLNGAGSSSGPNFSYQWAASAGGAIVSGPTTLSPLINAPGTYTLTVLNSQNGCTSTDAVVITQDIAPPTALIGAPPILTCLITQAPLNATGSSSGPAFTLSWSASGGGNIVNTTNILQPQINEPGVYTLNILNNNNGCSSSATVTVTETIDPPGASAGPDFVLHCNQPVAQLQGSSPLGAAVNYVWSTSNGAILSGGNTAQPSVGTPGIYLLTVTNPANGCVSTDQTEVTESIPVAFDYLVDPPVCKGFPGYIQFGQVLGGTPPYQYSISGGFTFSPQTFYGNLNDGVYDLVVRDANGCDLFEEALLPPGVDVELLVEREVFLNLGESYQVQVFVNIDESDIESISWSPDMFLSCNDCLTPIVTPVQSIDYLVTVVTEEGCEGEVRISFRVKKEAKVFVPNIFSPNGDGENDVFMIFAGNQVAKVNRFQVYNRWGESMFQDYDFQPNDPAHSWDGFHRGEMMNSGVFIWYAEIEMIDGRVELFEGSVTLIR